MYIYKECAVVGPPPPTQLSTGKWYYIDVLTNDRGDVVKIATQGPLVTSALVSMWNTQQLTSETYVWLEENRGSMKDFQQIKWIPELKQVRRRKECNKIESTRLICEKKTIQMLELKLERIYYLSQTFAPCLLAGLDAQFLDHSSHSPAAPLDVRSVHWYFKDKRGVRQGPHLFDTLAIIWKYHEISSKTLVYANGMAEYKTIKNVPALLKELRAGGGESGQQQTINARAKGEDWIQKQ